MPEAGAAGLLSAGPPALQRLALNGVRSVTDAAFSGVTGVTDAAGAPRAADPEGERGTRRGDGASTGPSLRSLSLVKCRGLRVLALGLVPDAQTHLADGDGVLHGVVHSSVHGSSVRGSATNVAGGGFLGDVGTSSSDEPSGCRSGEGVVNAFGRSHTHGSAAAAAAVARPPPRWVPAGTRLASLEQLRLGLSGVAVLALSLPALTHLDVSSCDLLCELELRCPALLTLHAWSCGALRKGALTRAAGGCARLAPPGAGRRAAIQQGTSEALDASR
eukprot:354554-Chlamydomonas_euryale.AAC.2